MLEINNIHWRYIKKNWLEIIHIHPREDNDR